MEEEDGRGRKSAMEGRGGGEMGRWGRRGEVSREESGERDLQGSGFEDGEENVRPPGEDARGSHILAGL